MINLNSISNILIHGEGIGWRGKTRKSGYEQTEETKTGIRRGQGYTQGLGGNKDIHRD